MFELKPVPGILYWSKRDTTYDYPLMPEECFFGGDVVVVAPRLMYKLTGITIPDKEQSDVLA
jgi:hypothetical protein